MTNKIRFALVGTGMMGREHIRNLLLMPEAEITALVDPVSDSRNSAQALLPHPVGHYSDLAAAMNAQAIDAIVLSSPNYTHHDILKPIMGSGLHILCEKPMATNLGDAKHLADLARTHAGIFWVGMEYRYMPPALAFVEEIKAGKVGRLQMLAIREHRFPFLPKVGDWNRFSANTGGTMVEKCCHFFDLMRLIVGGEAVRVYCSGAMDVNHQDERYGGRKPDIIDNSYTIVDFDNGVRAMLDLCMFADGSKEQEEIAATGDKAKLEVFIPSGEIVFSPRVGFMAPKKVERRHVEVDETALKAGSHHGATYYQQKAFIGAVLGRGQVAVTADDGLRAVAIGLAAELSAQEKRAVLMSELAI
jgi:predicted dehydrogenase